MKCQLPSLIILSPFTNSISIASMVVTTLLPYILTLVSYSSTVRLPLLSTIDRPQSFSQSFLAQSKAPIQPVSLSSINPSLVILPFRRRCKCNSKENNALHAWKRWGIQLTKTVSRKKSRMAKRLRPKRICLMRDESKEIRWVHCLLTRSCRGVRVCMPIFLLSSTCSFIL